MAFLIIGRPTYKQGTKMMPIIIAYVETQWLVNRIGTASLNVSNDSILKLRLLRFLLFEVVFAYAFSIVSSVIECQRRLTYP